MTAVAKIQAARISARKSYPWIAPFLIRLDPREKAGCNTIATDLHGRLYYDPEIVEQLSADQLAYEVKKATMPLVLNHGRRASTVVHDKRSQEVWSKASDIVVNELMILDRQHVPQSATTTANTFDEDGRELPSHLSLEQYYGILYSQVEEEEGGGGGGDGPVEEGKGPVDEPLEGGKSKDGQDKPWEDEYEPPKLGEDSEGLDDQTQDELRKEMVDKRGSDSMSRSGNNALETMAAKVAGHKISPQQLLRMAIVKSLDGRKQGFDSPTYRRVSRRPSVSSFLRPTYESPTPRICVMVDVSGSMGTDDIELAFGMIDTALTGMKCRQLRVVGANTDINTDQIVTKMSDVDLDIGGGTKMDVAVNKIMAEPPSTIPDLLILVTDGGTYWPKQTKAPFVACITRPEDQDPLWEKAHDWMPLIYMVD